MKNLKVAVAVVAGIVGGGLASANAAPITLYYSTDGTTYNVLSAATTNGLNSFSGTVDSTPFTVQFQASGTGTGSTPLPQPNFNTSTITITSSAAGTIYLGAIETGLTNTAVNAFSVSLGSNAGNPGTIEESFYAGSTVSLSGAALVDQTLLATSPNTTVVAAAPALTSPYQVGERFKITFTSAGTIQGTIQEAALVPEPVSLSILGAGLVGLGLVRRRRA